MCTCKLTFLAISVIVGLVMAESREDGLKKVHAYWDESERTNCNLDEIIIEDTIK